MNWTQLLVPLDGTPLAEAPLPYAEAIAKATGAPLALLSVVEREPRGLTGRSDQRATTIEQRNQQSREEYLARTATLLATQGLRVTTTVIVGDPAAQILAASERNDALVVMATHGRGAIERWLIGSVADAVMRLNTRPTLLVRAPYVRVPRRQVRLQQLMVPLDGSPLAETALPIARELAAATRAKITLVRVQSWLTRWGEPVWSVPELTQMEDEATAEATAYLSQARGLLPEDLPVETVVLRGGSPGPSLLEFVVQEQIDLVVISTHGWGGGRRLLVGSTTDHLVRGGVPTLLVRAEQAQSVALPPSVEEAR